MAGVFCITLKHATTKHAQTIGLLERSIKQALKIETGKRRPLRHKHVCIAVLNYNTSYNSNTGCEPSRVFMDASLIKSLIRKWVSVHRKLPLQTSQFAQDVLEQTEMIFQDLRNNAMEAYIKYKASYDKKLTPQDSNKQITFASGSLKQIIMQAKFPLQIFGGLDITFLKRCYRTIII